MTASLFPEFDTPAPKAPATTAPLFELPASATVPAAANWGPRPEQPHRVAPDVPILETRLTLPAEDSAGELAFGFAV